MNVLVDGLRLAVGTLTMIPVRPPGRIDPAVAAVAMSLAPVASVPVAATGALAVCSGNALGLPPLMTAILAVAGLTLASGALHLDGLADTTDALAVPGGRARRLEVMRRGDVGPAGVSALVFVLLTQIVSLAEVLDSQGATKAAVTIGLAVAVSRATLVLACLRGVPAARAEGLGTGVAGSVPLAAALIISGLMTAVAFGLSGISGLSGVLTAVVAASLVIIQARRTIGGVTGDVLGACVEAALTAYLVVQVADPISG